MIKAVEITVKGKTLRGIYHKPDNAGKVPLVIMYHGFTGYKHEIHFMFSKASRVLEKHGIASLRFDFSGSGDSDGEFYEMTFSSELEEALEIFDYARSLEFVDTNNIYLVGMSMGGAIASVVASKRKDNVKKMALWAPAGELDAALKRYIHGTVGEINFDFEDKMDLNAHVISKKLIDEIATLDIFEWAKDYKNFVLLIHGSKDEIVLLEGSKKYLEIYGDKAKLHIVQGANHTFDKQKWEYEVINETVQFFEK